MFLDRRLRAQGTGLRDLVPLPGGVRGGLSGPAT